MARSVKNEEFTEFCKCDCSVKQSDSRVRSSQCFASMQRCQEFPTERNTLFKVFFKGVHETNLDHFFKFFDAQVFCSAQDWPQR